MLFFFNDTATTEIYTYGHTLSLHDALPISRFACIAGRRISLSTRTTLCPSRDSTIASAMLVVDLPSASTVLVTMNDRGRSEEHTSELQSLMRISYAVFCLKKKKTNIQNTDQTTRN